MIVGLQELLRRHPFAQDLEDEIIVTIAACAKNVVFQTDNYVFHEGAPADNIYLIRRGSIGLEMFAPGQAPFTFLTVKSGGVLGADCLIPPYRWSFDARALETTLAIGFDANRLREECESDHRVGYEMMKRFIPPLFRRLQMIALAELANIR